MMTDTEMLDFIDSLQSSLSSYGGWKLRKSSSNRGFILLTTSEQPNYLTVREAIQAYVDESKKEN